jgi:hypothetical protein
LGWKLSKAQRDDIDYLSYSLGGTAGFLPRVKLMHNTGRLKGGDIKRLCMGALPYLFANRLANKVNQNALDAMIEIHRITLEMDCNADDESINHERVLKQRQKRMAELMCTYERGAPRSELPILTHEFVHVPEQVYEWNNVRNYWVFFSERCTNSSQSICFCARYA